MRYNMDEKVYKCERCKTRLFTTNGSFYNGVLLCDRCRSIAQIEQEQGRYDFTLAGLPVGGR